MDQNIDKDKKNIMFTLYRKMVLYARCDKSIHILVVNFIIQIFCQIRSSMTLVILYLLAFIFQGVVWRTKFCLALITEHRKTGFVHMIMLRNEINFISRK
jgi:hypothetical protein